MYVNKVTSTVISAMFLLLILSSVNLSSVKLVNAATGDLVNYNNNFNMYTSPNDPNKDSAMQNADCVVNFMQTYVYAASSADNCSSPSTPPTPTPTEQSQTPMQSQTPYQSQAYQATPVPEGPQTAVSGQSDSAGVVKVVDTTNANGATLTPIQSTSFATNQNNPQDDDNDDNDKDARDKDNDDDNDDNDKDARDKDNDDDNDDNDKDARDKDNDDDNDKDENKVYNENTVSKQERKLLLTTCFERGYDKGDYLSTEEIVKCAENYNS
jgi:hypothetical protein